MNKKTKAPRVAKITLHNTKIDIPEKDRIEIIGFLNKTLASVSDLYAQLKHSHWNIKGKEFISLHLLFDTIAEEVEGQVDIIAERIMTLGGSALGTVQEIVKNTQLRVFPTNIFSAEKILDHLTHNMAILGELSRENMEETEKLNDMVTNEIYVGLARMLDKNLWFLEAHLQK